MEKKEAMKILKDFRDKSALFSVRTALDTIIPELKENEDERIRKMLIYQMERWHEAGYEWDAERKELRKLSQSEVTKMDGQEQKSAWSEKDEAGLSDTLWAIQQARAIAKDENDMGNLWYAEKWLKSLKDRVGCEADCTTTKEWSEEDEAMFQGVIETEQYMLDVVYGHKIFAVGNEGIKEECTKELSWLKSLKDRIK